MDKLQTACDARMPEFMKLWETLVNTDSGSGHSEGLRRVAAILEEQLKSLGFAIKRIPAKEENGEYNIVATKTGKGTSSILLMAHMDTVFPPGTAAERPFRCDAEWAYGPGVSDCKSGICTIIQGLTVLQGFDDYKKITVLFNCDEEIGSPSSEKIIMDLAKDHDVTLSYEPGDEGDQVTVSRKGTARLKVRTHGKNSHAGSAPEKGRNAFMELIYQVERLAKIANPEKKTTVEFTIGKSGDRLNVVPAYAEADADVRVTYLEELDRLDADIAAVIAERRIPDCRVEAWLERGRPPFSPNPGTEALTRLAQSIYKETGRETSGNHAGGASDANFSSLAGCISLCSLGPAKGGPNHTPTEKANISTVVPRMYLMVRLIQELAKPATLAALKK